MKITVYPPPPQPKPRLYPLLTLITTSLYRFDLGAALAAAHAVAQRRGLPPDAVAPLAVPLEYWHLLCHCPHEADGALHPDPLTAAVIVASRRGAAAVPHALTGHPLYTVLASQVPLSPTNARAEPCDVWCPTVDDVRHVLARICDAPPLEPVPFKALDSECYRDLYTLGLLRVAGLALVPSPTLAAIGWDIGGEV